LEFKSERQLLLGTMLKRKEILGLRKSQKRSYLATCR